MHNSFVYSPSQTTQRHRKKNFKTGLNTQNNLLQSCKPVPGFTNSFSQFNKSIMH